ncbi:MAG: hypothetical protein MJ180_05090 [Candidatus Gastranaerophilales bacterium]|nr:hypothetical protein [Candidatus Gastranaerophilales bacterium]
MYFDENNNIVIEEDDECITCANLNKGVACPLIQALAQGVVFMEDSLTVSNCGFYEKFERHLRLVIPLDK